VSSPSSWPATGWYPDPERPGRHRYWDGQAWAARPEATKPADEINVRAVAIAVALTAAVLALAIGGRSLVGTTGGSTSRSTATAPEPTFSLPEITESTGVTTPADEAPPSTYMPADEMPSASPEVRMWMATYGYVFVGIQSAASRINGDLERNDLDALGRDCRSLVTVAEEGRGTPPVPISSVDAHWKAALAGFSEGGRLCSDAASASDGGRWQEAQAYFDHASSEWNLAREGMAEG
jgi:hypothetical protein